MADAIALAAAAARAQVRADLAYALALRGGVVAATVTTVVAAIGTPADNEVPVGACNNANVTFTLAHAPIVGSVKVYLTGVRVTAFTIVGNIITMTVAPLATDNVLVDSRY